MSKMRQSVRNSLRIIWAIVSKDIVDAVRNRTMLSILIGSLSIVLTGWALPWLTQFSTPPTICVYDEVSSTLTAALVENEAVRLCLADSQPELEAILARANRELLGLIVPADFDQTVASGGVPELAGWYVWSSRFAASDLKAEWEERLSALLDYPVRIDVEGHIVYPSEENDAGVASITSVLVMIIAILGVSMAPYLLFEEKKSQTIAVLRVSPTTIYQVIAGKAIAGLSYTLAAAGVALAFNVASVVHWETAILAAITAGIFATGVGLVLGGIFADSQDMGLWIAIPMAIILLPVILSMGERTMSEPLATAINWIPTVPLTHALTLSFTCEGGLRSAWPYLARAAIVTLPIYALAVWISRTGER